MQMTMPEAITVSVCALAQAAVLIFLFRNFDR